MGKRKSVLSTNGTGTTGYDYGEKNELGCYLTPHTKFHFRMIIDISVKTLYTCWNKS